MTNEHTYSVKNLKTWNGREGYGWQCSLYRDGKRVAEVTDHGNGGDIDFNWFDFKEPRVDGKYEHWKEGIRERKMTPEEKIYFEFCLSLPKKKNEWSDEMENVSPDSYAAGLADDFELKKAFKRDLKSKLLFVAEDGLRYVSFKNKVDLNSDCIVDHVAEKYPDRDFLNYKPEEQAFQEYRTALGV